MNPPQLSPNALGSTVANPFVSLRRSCSLTACLIAAVFAAPNAHASIFHGETLDKVADVLTWVVLIIAPIVGITVFLLIHVLPEKIAERRHHPQTKAIQCLCLLSLVFGGVLWPLAWLWAYTKPVIHKLAYGTDKVEHEEDEIAHTTTEQQEEAELKELYRRAAELESRRSHKPGATRKV
jgi:CBS domain containing-hemolysin-like protein